jgi:hypothetical protein
MRVFTSRPGLRLEKKQMGRKDFVEAAWRLQLAGLQKPAEIVEYPECENSRRGFFQVVSWGVCAEVQARVRR